jgi:hypothetical protein
MRAASRQIEVCNLPFKSAILTLILLDAIPAMLLIRLAISIFALTLLGLAFSLSSAQSGQNGSGVEAATFSQR